MKIRTIVVTALLAAAMPFAAMADADDKAEDITKALNLDRTRSQQVQQVLKNYHDQHEILKEQKEDQLEAILTDDEMDRLKAIKKSKKHDKKNR